MIFYVKLVGSVMFTTSGIIKKENASVGLLVLKKLWHGN